MQRMIFGLFVLVVAEKRAWGKAVVKAPRAT
jgi:hypothetical protein